MKTMLSGKSAVITGGSKGIGAAIAQSFAENGAEVLIVARTEADLRETAKRIRAETGARVETLATDLREAAAPAAAVAAAVKAFGKLDIVVNNAGATKRADFFELTDEDFVDGFALKFFSMMRMTKAAWPHLIDARGSILNIIGVGARYGAPEFTIGGPVNSACHNFTKAMAERGRADGVRVNAINPGPVRTPRLQRTIERMMADRGITQAEAMDQVRNNFQATRVGEPEDIANLALFVTSAKGDLLHGSVIDMDGGAIKAL
jgi:NAD(P)-dependent dehydrogenase (short-subunit alcohol dehydrogenase family)